MGMEDEMDGFNIIDQAIVTLKNPRPNYEKMGFGRFLSETDGDKNNHGDCFNYGSVSGCDENCPVLLRGECEVQEQNEKQLGLDHIPLSGGYTCDECHIKLNAQSIDRSLRCPNCKLGVMRKISAMEWASS
jgi:DNA-directed RNA polymerase subunit RPC12/RpoP